MRVLILLLLCAFVHAEILECGQFEKIHNYIGKGTLILFDIDDTLIVPKQMLGSDEWFGHRCRFYREKGLEQGKALEKALAEWEAIRHITEMELVEEGAVQIIKELQEKGVRCMGFTTQGLALATRTAQQLQSFGIDLKKSIPFQDDCYLEVDNHGVLFRNGIFFTSGTNKGKAFFALCDKMGYTPRRILFINDKYSHLRELEKVAEERNVNFIGLRYGYSDSRKKNFSWEIADMQFSESSFAHILSDSEAQAKITGAKNI